MRFIRQVMVITAKDLRAEMRTKEAINASFAFAIVVLLILSFAFEPTEDTTREISGGLLWIVFLFAGTLILNRSFARELPNDCLDALIAAPVPGPRRPTRAGRCDRLRVRAASQGHTQIGGEQAEDYLARADHARAAAPRGYVFGAWPRRLCVRGCQGRPAAP